MIKIFCLVRILEPFIHHYGVIRIIFDQSETLLFHGVCENSGVVEDAECLDLRASELVGWLIPADPIRCGSGLHKKIRPRPSQLSTTIHFLGPYNLTRLVPSVKVSYTTRY